MNQQFKIVRCPRCRARGVSVEVLKNISLPEKFSSYRDPAESFGRCGVCKCGVILQTLLVSEFGGVRSVIGVLPLVPNRVPEHLPENIQLYFQQGIDNISQENWDAAGSMFRKTLESVLKKEFPDNAGLPLIKQIGQASRDGKLTPGLAGWANEIRIWGNDATHAEDPFKAEEAQQMQEFTESVLIYLITLPKKLEIAKKRRSSGTEAPVIN